MAYLITPVAVAVHRAEENPVFGEAVTRVSVLDEGAGPFVQLEQDEKTIRLDMEEFELCLSVAKKLIAAYPAEEKQ